MFDFASHWTQLHWIIAGLCVTFVTTTCWLLHLLHNSLESADEAWRQANKYKRWHAEAESQLRCLGTYLNAKP